MRFNAVALLVAAAAVLAQDSSSIEATGTVAATAAATKAAATSAAAAPAETTADVVINPNYVNEIMGRGKALWAFLPVSIVGTVASLIPFFRNFDQGVQADEQS
ncbi:hypothetical protein BJ741DRAFT_586456 [Chytriomyces cf. hyalinus JEL632]|nr:hypothetical protein BJ741DRAFT_586456 [Chytriomyces cf. hyalinus JEL632]